jgi:hypothetical protein
VGAAPGLTAQPNRRLLIVSNHLPVRMKSSAAGGWEFEWDEDALVAQAKVRLARAAQAVQAWRR